ATCPRTWPSATAFSRSPISKRIPFRSCPAAVSTSATFRFTRSTAQQPPLAWLSASSPRNEDSVPQTSCASAHEVQLLRVRSSQADHFGSDLGVLQDELCTRDAAPRSRDKAQRTADHRRRRHEHRRWMDALIDVEEQPEKEGAQERGQTKRDELADGLEQA